MCAKSLSFVQLFATLLTVACQAPLSMDFPGKKTGMACHALLQRIFLTWGSNTQLLHIMHWQVGSLPLAPHGNPQIAPKTKPKELEVLNVTY